MEPPPLLTSPTGNNKIWSILCHLSSLLGVGFILPLIVYLSMRDESPYVEANARAVLNFHLSVLIYCICCIPLIFVIIGLPILIVIGIATFILSIVGAVKASNGECYSYPLTLQLIKEKQSN